MGGLEIRLLYWEENKPELPDQPLDFSITFSVEGSRWTKELLVLTSNSIANLAMGPSLAPVKSQDDFKIIFYSKPSWYHYPQQTLRVREAPKKISGLFYKKYW